MKQHFFKKNTLQLAIISCLFSPISTYVIADDKTPEKADVETITVTARFKSESIIEIPMSISSISAMDIQARNYTDAKDIYRTLAGAAMPRGQLILRGLSGGNSVSPNTTTTFVDDIPLEFTNLSDIERVEVLRGPQGTLYGSNAIGGTVRIITKKPVLDQFELFGSAQTGVEKNVEGYDSTLSIGVNIPIVEGKVALRVNGNIDNDKLAIVNMNTGIQSTKSDSFIRSQLLWQLNDDIAVTLGYSNIKHDANGEDVGDLSTPGFYYDYSLSENASSTYGYDVTLFTGPCEPNAIRAICKGGSAPIAFTGVPEKYQIWESLNDWNKENTDVFTLNVQSDNFFGFATMTYAGSFREYDSQGLVNWSRLDAVDLFKTWIIEDDFHERTTHELRFQNLDMSSPLSWTVGLFYDKLETKNALGYQNQYHEAGDITSALALYLWDTDVTQLGIDTFNNPQQNWQSAILDDTEKEFSVFADVAYTVDLGDMGELELSAGVRRFELEDSYHDVEMGVWGEGETIIGGQENDNRYKFSASYRPSNDFSVYALYSEGYRPGGNNIPLPNTPECLNHPDAVNRKDRYSSDSIDNYELGLKASAFDGAFDFAFAVYHIDWTDIKTRVHIGSRDGKCNRVYIANAGKAESNGFEFESTIQLMDELTMTLNTSYTNSKLTEDNATIGGEKGDEMTMVPDWNGYLAFDQGFDFFGKQAFVRADYTYYGAYKTHFKISPEDEVPSYSYVNLSSRLEVSESVTLSLHLNNLFDKEAIKYQDAASNTLAPQYIEFLNERNLTVRIDYTFF
jgi:outer membrane receptor protein involved in Fe transport